MKITSTLSEEIKKRVRLYLSGETTFDEFFDWFLVETWDIEETGLREAEKLSHEITGLYAEYSEGLITKEEFKSHLGSLVEESEEKVVSNSTVTKISFPDYRRPAPAGL